MKKGKIKSPGPGSIALSKADDVVLWIFIIMIVLIPNFCRASVINYIAPDILFSYQDTGPKIDGFSYYRYVLLIVCAVILLAVFIIKLLSGYKIKPSPFHIPFMILFAAVLLSGVFAEYKTLSLVGHFEQHEGTLAYLIYLMVFFIAANTKFNMSAIKKIYFAFYPVLIINAVLGLLYFYDYNVLNSGAFASLVFSDQIEIGKGASFSSTLGNPNYTSGFGAVLAAIFLTKGLYTSSLKQKTLDLVLFGLACATILTSLSTSGFVTISVLLPVIILAVVNRDRGLKRLISSVVVTVIIFALILSALVIQRPTVWEESVGFFQKIQAIMIEYKDYQGEDRLSSYASGSGRVPIWVNTLQLVKERPLLGYGLDTLTYYYPAVSLWGEAVTKPHNIYLALAYGAGVTALMAFLALIVLGLYHFCAGYFRHKIIDKAGLILPLFFGWLAYLIQGLFNDTVIGTTFIFWIIFGMMVSLSGSDNEPDACTVKKQ